MDNPASHVASLLQHSTRDFAMGRILVGLGKLTHQDTQRVLQLQLELGLKFGEAAKQLQLITEEDVQQVLSRQFAYSYVDSTISLDRVELSLLTDPLGLQAEMIRDVRTDLMLNWFSEQRKMLSVITFEPNDNDQQFISNLALSFAQSGKRTILVEANLRNPGQSRIFNLRDKHGLSDILAGRTGVEVIHRVDKLQHLSLLSAGTTPPNPQELISSSAFERLLYDLVSKFDVVLCDTPLQSVAADALLIAARTGGGLLVIGKHQTRVKQARDFCKKMETAGVPAAGAVLVEG